MLSHRRALQANFCWHFQGFGHFNTIWGWLRLPNWMDYYKHCMISLGKVLRPSKKAAGIFFQNVDSNSPAAIILPILKEQASVLWNNWHQRCGYFQPLSLTSFTWPILPEGSTHGTGLDGPLNASLLRAPLCGANNHTFDISFTTNLYDMVSFNKIINQILLISYDQDGLGMVFEQSQRDDCPPPLCLCVPLSYIDCFSPLSLFQNIFKMDTDVAGNAFCRRG